jgi:hypothetical protein
MASFANWVDSHGLAFLVGLIISGISLFLGSKLGNSAFYALSSILFVILIVLVVGFESRNSNRLLAVFLSFFILRYVPILKFDQPLFDDPWSDLRTATFFMDAGRVVSLPQLPNPALQDYARWPVVHVLSVAVSQTLGIDLFGVFTYFGPIVALPALVFIFLLARELFQDARKAAITALILSIFSISIYWQVQLVRQNLALSIFCGALYAYVKFRKSEIRAMLIISLLLFSVLPLIHHLTSLAALATLALAFVIEKIYRKNNISASLVIYFVSITLLTWAVTSQGEFIFPELYFRTLALLFGYGVGRYVTIEARLLTHLDFFAYLTFLRLLLLAGGAFLGVFYAIKRRLHFAELLIAFFIGNGILLSLSLLRATIEERFALLLVLPTSLLMAFIRPKKTWLLALFLVLLVLPAPFTLYETFDATPTYVYQADSTVNYRYFSFTQFRGEDAFALAQWNAKFDRNAVLTDTYNLQIMQQYSDPSVLYPVTLPLPPIQRFFFNRYYIIEGQRKPELVILARFAIRGNVIYNDGAQFGYYDPSA